MPPPLALLLTIGFIVYLNRRLTKETPGLSKDLWFPCIWIFFTGSRFPTQWLDMFGISLGGTSMQEGSPLDALFFMSLIIAGFLVLRRRGVTLASLARENVWLSVFFAYCLISILWSDFPFVATKRWVKTLGHPVMALIILTTPNPYLALRVVIKRCAFMMISLSVLFIKYFPQYGRGFDAWSGAATNSGINLNKNELGYCCMIFGIFFAWNIICARHIEDKKARRAEQTINWVFIGLVVWLLQMSNSMTSLLTMSLGAVTMMGLGLKFISKRYFGTWFVTVCVLAASLELGIGVYKPALEMMGRNPTLTDRTEVWADALELDDSPILGAGFESFWLGDRLKAMWAKWWWQPTQAHSGYIETYLNLGAVGVLLFAIMIISTFRKITARFLTDFDFARLRMGFLLTILAYNYTEATFKAVHLVWTIFYIIALDVPRSTSLNTAAKPTRYEPFPNRSGLM